MAVGTRVREIGAKETPLAATKASRDTAEVDYEPLLPVEMKLILWSLGLGAVLMVVLVGLSYSFFKG